MKDKCVNPSPGAAMKSGGIKHVHTHVHHHMAGGMAMGGLSKRKIEKLAEHEAEEAAALRSIAKRKK